MVGDTACMYSCVCLKAAALVSGPLSSFMGNKHKQLGATTSATTIVCVIIGEPINRWVLLQMFYRVVLFSGVYCDVAMHVRPEMTLCS